MKFSIQQLDGITDQRKNFVGISNQQVELDGNKADIKMVGFHPQLRCWTLFSSNISCLSVIFNVSFFNLNFGQYVGRKTDFRPKKAYYHLVENRKISSCAGLFISL